jgi:hypothetical protein
MGGLEGCLAFEDRVAPVTEAVEKKKDTAHVRPLEKNLQLL